jgi:hypothetical protein
MDFPKFLFNKFITIYNPFLYYLLMYIVYGSQNGNAESVAKNVYDRLDDIVLTKTLISLDQTLELFRHKHFERPFLLFSLLLEMGMYLLMRKNGGGF